MNQPQAGTLTLNGTEQRFTSTRAALEAGIAIIYQELHLVPELTVAENLMLGQLPSRLGVVDERTLARALDALERLGEHIDPGIPVKYLSIGQRQMIEIGKALMRDARVIAFDEPTSSLSARETTQLFRIIRALRAEGRAIIYVTHRMEEVYELCDRVTVFRDGRRIDTFDAVTDLDRDRLIGCMVGRSIEDVRLPAAPGRRRADRGEGAGGVVRAGVVHRAARRDRRLLRRGRRPLGADEAAVRRRAPERGHVELNGKRVAFGSPRDAVRAGLALCPEDRKQEGIVAIASVADNLNISARRHFSPARVLLDGRRERELAQRYIERLAIKTRDGDTPIGALSGGNQQKVVLARWLAERIDVFLMDEPTRGIDVGARAEITTCSTNSRKGRTVILVSSDLPR